nr:unnamed protein product [Callosobruchus analis]
MKLQKSLNVIVFDLSFPKEMAVSVVVSLLSKMAACLNHLSIWVRVMVFPSALVSPNLANRTNWSSSDPPPAAMVLMSMWRDDF